MTHRHEPGHNPTPASDPVARLVRLAEPVPEREAVDVQRLLARLQGEAEKAAVGRIRSVSSVRNRSTVSQNGSHNISGRRRPGSISGRNRPTGWPGWATAAAVMLVLGIGAVIIARFVPMSAPHGSNTGDGGTDVANADDASHANNVHTPGNTNAAPNLQPVSPIRLQVDPATGTLASLLHPTDGWVMPGAPELELPLAMTPDTVSNLAAYQARFRHMPDAMNKLSAYGFVVGPAISTDDPVEFYRRTLADGQAPMVTVDVAMHLAHARLESTRQAVEDRVLAPLLQRTLDHLDGQLATLDGKFRAGSDGARALQRARLFVAVARALQAGNEAEEFVRPALCCAVAMRVHGAGMGVYNADMWDALCCFNDTLPEADRIPDIHGWFTGLQLRHLLDLYVNQHRVEAIRQRMPQFADAAIAEVERIMSARHSLASDACGRVVDYSTFAVPDRSTRNVRITNCWRTLQWLRQLQLPLTGDRVSKLTGLLVADALCRLDHAHENGETEWRRVVALIDFLDGLQESLAPFAVRALARQMLGEQYLPAMLASPGVAERLCDVLRYVQVDGVDDPDPAQPRTSANVCIGQPDYPDEKALRFMAGLRDAPGDPQADGSPEPLELMAALGSDRAAWLLESGTQHVEGTPSMPQPWRVLRPDFERIARAGSDRFRTINHDWMHTESTLIRPEGRAAGYPAYMTSEVYADRLLGAALGNYVMRHPETDIHNDKIPQATDEVVDLPAQRGSTVEPLPHVYASLLDVVRHMRLGLQQLDALPATERDLLLATEDTLRDLVRFSKKVLAGDDLGEDGIEWVARFADKLERVTFGQGRPGMMGTTVLRAADASANRGHTLAATGFLRSMWVLNRLPSGEVVISVGCVASYYQQEDVGPTPMHVEEWRRLLYKRNGDAPTCPSWMNSYQWQNR